MQESRNLTGALIFVESTVSEDSVSTVTPEPVSRRNASPITPLEIVTSAYSGADYYETGAWEDDNPYAAPIAIMPPVTNVPLPVKGIPRVTSNFGYRPEYGRYHFGIDMAMAVGDTVRCTMPGKVTAVSTDKGYGHYIIIQHDNGLETRYAHLSKAMVGIADRVTDDQPIALSGNSGRSTGPHLHLETRYKSIPLNPRLVFAFP